MSHRKPFLGFFLLAVAFIGPRFAAADTTAVRLNPQNTKVPFCYLAGGKRSWPILSRDLGDGDRLMLTAKRGDVVLAMGESVSFDGITVSTSPAGRLQVTMASDGTAGVFELLVALELASGEKGEQTLSLHPAPPRAADFLYRRSRR